MAYDLNNELSNYLQSVGNFIAHTQFIIMTAGVISHHAT